MTFQVSKTSELWTHSMGGWCRCPAAEEQPWVCGWGYISPSSGASPRSENQIKTRTLSNTCRGASTLKFRVTEAILQQIVSEQAYLLELRPESGYTSPQVSLGCDLTVLNGWYMILPCSLSCTLCETKLPITPYRVIKVRPLL